MVDFLFATAKQENSHIMLNSKKLAQRYRELGVLPKPWWVIGSASFMFFTEHGDLAVALTKRTGETAFSGKWSLLPSGCADNVNELTYPHKIVERESREELIISVNGTMFDPIKFSYMPPHPTVEIYDEATAKKYIDEGYVYCSRRDSKYYFFRKYFVLLLPEMLILSDGELHDGQPLDRYVALVLLKNLDKKAKSIYLFKSKKRIKNKTIDLTEYQTPTLEWAKNNLRDIT